MHFAITQLPPSVYFASYKSACALGCGQCSLSATNCVQCRIQPGRRLNNPPLCSCIGERQGENCDCPSGTFDDGTGANCAPCLRNCLACANGSSCTTCAGSLRFQAAELACGCDSGSFRSATDCLACSVGCSVCANGSSCSACASGYELNAANQCTPVVGSALVAKSDSGAHGTPPVLVAVIVLLVLLCLAVSLYALLKKHRAQRQQSLKVYPEQSQDLKSSQVQLNLTSMKSNMNITTENETESPSPVKKSTPITQRESSDFSFYQGLRRDVPRALNSEPRVATTEHETQSQFEVNNPAEFNDSAENENENDGYGTPEDGLYSQ